jgi:putative oxidoreductase
MIVYASTLAGPEGSRRPARWLTIEPMTRLLPHEDGPRAIILIRLMVGGVFLSEGIQKFLFPEVRGAGRFADIGLPAPEALGAFVGGFETVCGALVLLGLLTRLAARTGPC